MSMGETGPKMLDPAAASEETGGLAPDLWYFTDMGNGSPNFVFMRLRGY
jgi:hypothetical protein